MTCENQASEHSTFPEDGSMTGIQYEKRKHASAANATFSNEIVLMQTKKTNMFEDISS